MLRSLLTARLWAPLSLGFWLLACQTESRKTESSSTTPTDKVSADSTRPLQPAPDLVDSLSGPPLGQRASPTALPAADTTGATAFYDAFGRYLGGLRARPGAPLPDTVLSAPSWQPFAAGANAKWRRYERTHVRPIRRWASTGALDSASASLKTVFYPFSGPDLLNVYAYFPTADTYVLVGLEPVGVLPTPAVLAQPGLFRMVDAALWSVLSFSFFRTNSMATDFKSAELDGTLPILLLFAARTGHRVVDAQLVHLTPAGALAERAAQPGSQEVPGSRLVLLDSTGRQQTVYYFSADISDGKLGTTPGLTRFITSLGPVATFVKSASYLMHKSYFSRIRNLVLRQSEVILQDDSGIALRFFKPADWQLTHYGHYTKPISLFGRHFQADMLAAYQDSLHPPKKLPFGTGYNWRANESNLLLARRRQ